MTKTQTAPISGFTPGERAYIRNELDIFFSTLPSVAEGFQLRLWRGGPEAGQPLPRLFFTETGLAALRAMMADRRLADPQKFAHIRQELGIDPMPETEG